MLANSFTLKQRMIARQSCSPSPVAARMKIAVRATVLCKAASSLATPAPIAPEPLGKANCTMTMSIEEEDESGALSSWDAPPDAKQTQAWADWMARQLSSKLVGLTARTSRAQIRTLAVDSSAVVKGRIRAHNVDFVLRIEGTHLKAKDVGPIKGSVRVSLKTVEKKDAIHLSELEWDSDAAAAITPEVRADLRTAADTPLESALAIHLNDILWDVERRSMDKSMDE